MSYVRAALGQHQPFHPGRQLGAALGASFLGPAKEFHPGQVLTQDQRTDAEPEGAGFPSGAPSPAFLPIVSGAIRAYLFNAPSIPGVAIEGWGEIDPDDAAGLATTASTILGEFLAVATATGTATTAGAIEGYGEMDVDLRIGFQPSATDIAQAVWGQPFAPLNDPTSFGGLVTLLAKLARNRTVTDPVTGTMRVYDDDGVTVLVEADLYEDVAGTQPYQGQGADRRDRLA